MRHAAPDCLAMRAGGDRRRGRRRPSRRGRLGRFGARRARSAHHLDERRQGRLRHRDRPPEPRLVHAVTRRPDRGLLPAARRASVRDLELVVVDGRRVERETDATTSVVTRVAGAGLTFRQVDTARSGRYRITKTYVTDPARAVVLADVRVESLSGRPLSVWVRYDPAL